MPNAASSITPPMRPLRSIETRWNLAPLSSRDAAANNLLNAFDFSVQR